MSLATTFINDLIGYLCSYHEDTIQTIFSDDFMKMRTMITKEKRDLKDVIKK